MKMYLSKVGKDAWVALLAVCSVGLAACSSLAEKASKYYEKGLALVVLATECLAANDVERTIEYLDRSLKVSEKNITLQLIKVQALDSSAQTASAEAVFRKLIALYPQPRTLRHVLAQFYLTHNRPDAAEAEYRAIAAENPNDVQARLDVVRFITTVKGQKAALQHLQEVISSDSGNHELRFALAAMQQSQDDQRAAEAVFRSINEKSGDSPDAIKAKELAEQIRGSIFAARKNYVGSIAAFRRAYDAAPSDVQPMECKAGIFRLRECGDVASHLREPLRVLQHTGGESFLGPFIASLERQMWIYNEDDLGVYYGNQSRSRLTWSAGL